ncbi:Transcriptional activator CadC [Luteitalea pratensis]|uniref:Transcriptional activator CadC n=1 Tax=Luteitalea pratensis TaxID=1855912 RepID=A0A143PQ37_LUTPR|nr:winged helix-turn-helix domain-containing protein [Luteitalea pratensis]AMY10827.1 Transcriptional activator CadC [Luteitalea pratensis]
MAVFEFGPFLLDPSTRLLHRDGVPQTLAPKTFDVLLLLIEQRARVVSKDELLQTVWPGTFVEEGNLSQQIFLLRKILGADDQPEYISTVPRRGYRFVAEVRERSEEPRALPRATRLSHTLSRRLATPLISGVLIAGVASLAYIRWGGSAAETADPRIISVTSLPGLESSPSISPDGNFVVFSWTGPNPEGIPDLWVSAVDRDSRQRLTQTPTAAETSPAWSPNGRDIAFIRVGEGVFVVPALGGPEQKVGDSGSMVAWMPDGRSLLVRDGEPEAGTPYGIFQIDRETSKRTQITHAPSGIGGSAFDVSPDGRSLAFIRYERPGVGDVYVAPIAGGEAHRRTNWNTEISGVSWTPDGRDIVYAVLEEPGLDQTLFRTPAIGNRLDRGVRALHVSAESPSMSRPPPGESGRLAFTTARIDVALRLIDLQGPLSDGVFQSVGRFADSTRLDVPGPFSKDGERVAFRAVDDQVQRSCRRDVVHRYMQRLTPARERRVVRGVKTGAHHGQDRPDEALRLAQGQVEDESERQGGLDGQIREPLLPARSARRRHSPPSLGVWREPERHVAPTDEAALVRPPVPHPIVRLVRGMHPRLHPTIMPRGRR